MPILYVAIGRRLGYPMHLVEAHGHFFVRWESLDGKERVNFEGTSGLRVYSDSHYTEWPEKLSKDDLKYYLRNLTSAQELGLFLAIRGGSFDTLRRYPEASAAVSLAHQFNPGSLITGNLLANSVSPLTNGFSSLIWDDPKRK